MERKKIPHNRLISKSNRKIIETNFKAKLILLAHIYMTTYPSWLGTGISIKNGRVKYTGFMYAKHSPHTLSEMIWSSKCFPHVNIGCQKPHVYFCHL